MKSDIDPRLGFLERATWCLSHMRQKNSDHMASCMRMAVGIEPLMHWVCKGQSTLWVSASSHFLPADIHHSILQLSSCCLSWHCHTVNCLPRRAGGYFRGRQMKRVIDVTMLQCSHLPSLHPSFTWDLPGHTTNNYAFPPAQSSFILECGETRFKPEIRSQERLAAKLVGEVASRASQPVVNLEFENHDDYRLMRE